MNVELHIERVVLEGVDLGPAERAQVGVALEQQLAALVRARGVRADLAAGGAVPSLAATEVSMPSAGAQQLGSRIAVAVGGAITGPTPGGASS